MLAVYPRSVGLLLAAGRGSRFDPTGQLSKLLHCIDGLPVACHSANALFPVCEQVLAVVRPGATELSRALLGMGCQVTECAQAELGMGHSLAWGVAEVERRFQPQVLVVMLADMPFVKPSTIQTLLAGLSPSVQALVPQYLEQRGNPGVFARSIFDRLRECSGDRGAAAVLGPDLLRALPVHDAAVLRDIDSLNDLTQA
jgi:molybdenum cofactor cytidylyltransferase